MNNYRSDAQTGSSLESFRSSGAIKSDTHPYKGHVIDAKSVPIDGGWTFAATVTKNGRVAKSVAASGQVVFTTSQHATDVALFLSRAWVDREGSRSVGQRKIQASPSTRPRSRRAALATRRRTDHSIT